MSSETKSDDLFDAILLAEDRFHVEGYRDGYEEGRRQGVWEGRHHGALHGARLAVEVSFYYGFAFTWKCLLQNNTEAKARKRLNTLESLIALIYNCPSHDPQYENLQEDVGKIRAKFRQVCSLLNVPADFQEYTGKNEGISFHVEGYRDGYEEGRRQGVWEGRHHGALHGARLAVEVSFYYGFAFTWKCLLQNNTEAKARKRLNTLESLIALIYNCPSHDPQYENLQEDVGKIRAKFRQVCSLLNVPADFQEYTGKNEGISF